jgi:solute carrier family 10 (sodium/bile acid cotransporter), member 7
MLEFLQRRWFLITLLILICSGFGIGYSIDAEQMSRFSSRYGGMISRVSTAVVLFLMSFTLDTRKLIAAIRAPGPVVWATLINFGLLPALAVPLMRLQMLEDFAVGLLVAAAVPSTLAAASVWTRKAGGNDAVSLLVTIVTNGSCFLVTPFWLSVGIGDGIQLDMAEMIRRLFETALVPIAAGQLARLHVSLRAVANRGKTFCGALAQGFILLLVFWASLQSGPRLADASGLVASSAGLVWGTCVVLHLLAILVLFLGGRAFGFAREDVIASTFAGSQKTLPIGIYIATDLLAGRGLPLAAFPILMFHASQLLLDTLFVEPFRKWSHAGERKSPP